MEASGNLLVELILDFLHSKNLTQTAETLKKEYVLLEGLPSSFTLGDSKGDDTDSGTEERDINELWNLEEHGPASAKSSFSLKSLTVQKSPSPSAIVSPSPSPSPFSSSSSSTSLAITSTTSPQHQSEEAKATETILQQLLANLNEFRREDDEDQWADDDTGYRRVPVDEYYLAQYPDEVENDGGTEEANTVFETYKQPISDATGCNNKSQQNGFLHDSEIERLNSYVSTFDSSGTNTSVTAPAAAPQPKEDEYDTFDLKVIYVKNRTGFEESKDFPIKLNTIIAGRYEIKEYLGSAAFSSAIQCFDHLTKRMVCIKIITNNKDFFDQSLDEIKLLTYINQNCDPDEKNVLQLYDYFYYKEHLFIVCELLRDNLYEFYKYNRNSGDELYFTLPRLKRVAKQCLMAMSYIHSLNLIHCDLKPENILIKSYSRCEVKIIDFGSSCFTNDSLGSYVQSRAYRAPEVVLGLPYDQKIDIWSLGCIFAELWNGAVLFLNDSVATLLAKINAILGPFPKEMLERGRHTSKFFTKRTNVLYEKREGKPGYSFLCPKKTTLKHRLKTSDDMFVDFLLKLLTLSPSERPTADEALLHPWLHS